jgi:hypothetical protein
MTFNTIKDLFMLGIINAYPHEPAAIVQFTNIINMIKTVLVDCSFLLVFVALGLIMVRFLRRRVWLKASS